MKRKRIIFLLLILIIAIISSYFALAKESRDFIRKGNSFYKKEKFKDAEVQYRKALEVEPNSNIAKFNLGTSYYRQGIFDKAKESFDGVDNKNFDKKDLASAYYNLGNSLLQDKKYAESIETYKKALVNDPKDKDAKYNLEYARKMLQQQQNKQNQQQNQSQKQNQQQNQQNQQNQNQENNRDKNKDNQQNQQQNQQQQNQQNQNSKQNQAKQPKISKEDAERILQALNNEEKNVQKKLKAKSAVKGQLEKNW